MCDPALRGSLALGLLARLRSLRWLPAAPLRPGVGVIAASERVGSFAIYLNKSGVEKRPSRFSLIGDARNFSAGNFVLFNIRHGCRIVSWQNNRAFYEVKIR